MTSKILICCCAEEKLFCLKLKNELNKIGLSTELIHVLNSNDYYNYCENLECAKRSIENCSVLIACISQKFNSEFETKFETFYAIKLEKKVIPFLYKDLIGNKTLLPLRNALNLKLNSYRVKESSIEEIIQQFINRRKLTVYFFIY